MLIELIYLAVGVLLLFFGADWLVRGSASIARNLNIRPMIIGLTVVAFATSVPEFVVSMIAGIKGNSDIALGNIIGSVIANIGLVLGICALIRPVRVERAIIKREVPIGIAAAFAMFIMSVDGVIGRIDGALLFMGMVAFIAYSVHGAIAERRNRQADEIPEKRPVAVSILLVSAGIAGILSGAHFLLDSAVSIARDCGISELFIGLTMVAVGTSLPELAASTVAAMKGHDDICVGNVVGSNIFNILCIIGLVALVSPLAVAADVLRCEMVFMLAFSILLLPILRTGFVISRIEGALMLAGYAVFVYFAYAT